MIYFNALRLKGTHFKIITAFIISANRTGAGISTESGIPDYRSEDVPHAHEFAID